MAYRNKNKKYRLLEIVLSINSLRSLLTIHLSYISILLLSYYIRLYKCTLNDHISLNGVYWQIRLKRFEFMFLVLIWRSLLHDLNRRQFWKGYRELVIFHRICKRGLCICIIKWLNMGLYTTSFLLWKKIFLLRVFFFLNRNNHEFTIIFIGHGKNTWGFSSIFF